MVFSQTERGGADLVGENSLPNDLANNLGLGVCRPVWAQCEVAEGAQTQPQFFFHDSTVCSENHDEADNGTYGAEKAQHSGAGSHPDPQPGMAAKPVVAPATPTRGRVAYRPCAKDITTLPK